MAQILTDAEIRWARDQIQLYQVLYPRYQELAKTLQRVLDRGARPLAPDAIVQARAKSIASFAEKILRKKDKYADPVHQLTDLCGARVITHLPAEVHAVSDFIKSQFIVDEHNSLDVSERLKPTEFGYRSVHYVVQFKPGVFPLQKNGETIDEGLYGLKAEIQVRTLAEHAWASFAHDRAYKSAFTIPAKWQRQLAELAALMENADATFARVQSGLGMYQANYGAYLTPEESESEIKILELVLEAEPENVELAHRIGKLAIGFENWDKAIEILSRYADKDYQPIWRDLGIALTKKNDRGQSRAEFQRGQEFLERASAPAYHDADALASYASTYKVTKPDRARELYREAFETDPTNLYALNLFLQYELAHNGDIAFVRMMRPVMEKAMERCREQIQVGVDMPWAYYNLGTFNLLLGNPYEALAAFAKAFQVSTASWMIRTSRDALTRIEGLRKDLPGFEWVERLLTLGLALRTDRQEEKEALQKFASKGKTPLTVPIIMVAGGTDLAVEEQIQSYRELLVKGFAGFRGTILSGATTSGISGLVGDVQQEYPDTITTIGYVPGYVKAGVTLDPRYQEIRRTHGSDFSPLEPLQMWTDVIAAGIDPAQVKLIGINGGNISAAEYRIALALGAHVGLIEGSGRAVARLVPDEDWNTSERLMYLPRDIMTLHAFLAPPKSEFDADAREVLGKRIHQDYQAEQIKNVREKEPSLNNWDHLPKNLQESNRLQADDMIAKVRRIGLEAHKVSGREIVFLQFTPQEIEQLAEMEHGRWVAERMLDGWRKGAAKDVEKKISPYLVGWDELKDEVKQYDRNAVAQIPKMLELVGWEVRRPTQAESETRSENA